MHLEYRTCSLECSRKVARALFINYIFSSLLLEKRQELFYIINPASRHERSELIEREPRRDGEIDSSRPSKIYEVELENRNLSNQHTKRPERTRCL